MILSLIRTLVVISTIALPATHCFAQAPTFESASVKPNVSGEIRSRIGIRAGGRLVATNVTLKELIMNAHQVKDFQISGGPNWMESDRFDVDAVAGENVPAEQVYLMTRALLEDRFALKLHRDSRDAEVYVLSTAKGGSKLREVKDAETAEHGIRMDVRWIHSDKTATVAAFASILENQLGRIVVDKTGLPGFYNIELRWGKSESGEAGPSFFTAIQEQLGLRLEASKQPIDILIIDSAAKPAPNPGKE